MQKEQFIPLANSFFSDNDGKLSPNDLFLYAYLYSGRTYFYDTTKTNLALIESEVRFVKKDQDNRRYVLTSMESLIKKEIIAVNCSDLKKSKHLIVSFKKIEKGYEKIPISFFAATTDPEEFMLLCYVQKIKRKITFEEFANVLGCSVSHTKSLVQKMEHRGVLNVNHGRYYVNDQGEYRRDKNEYKVTITPEDVNIGGINEREARDHNWYNRSHLIDVDDCIVYLTTADEKLKREAEKRIGQISSSVGKEKLETIMREAERQLSSEAYESKQREEQQLLMGFKGTPVRMKDGSLIEVTAENVVEVDFLKEVDKVYYVGETDFVGHLKQPYMQSFDIQRDLFGYSQKYAEATIEAVIEKLRIAISQGKLDKDAYFSFATLLKRIVNENNNGKKYDEDWEGDNWEEYPIGDNEFEEENASKQNRIDQEKRRVILEREQKEQAEKFEMYRTLWD